MKSERLLLLPLLFLIPLIVGRGASVQTRPSPAPGRTVDATGRASRALDTLSVDGARDATGEGRAFVEISAPRESFFVQEPIRLTLRFGVDSEFARTGMVQLFRQHLDIPVQITAPWPQDVPGIAPPDGGAGSIGESGAGDGNRPTFALGESVTSAGRGEDRKIDGRTYDVLEVEKTFLPASAGELAISEPLLRFAYATRFGEETLHGRVALDRIDAFVRGAPLRIAIRALPEEGRPAEFTGAVGRFSVTAEARPRELEVGESFQLVLRIEGEGNFESFEAPRLDRLDGLGGLHVRGTTEEKVATCRTITYDVAPIRTDVKAVPPIRFAFFDPDPPSGYRTVETAPIELGIRPRPGFDRGAATDVEGTSSTRPPRSDSPWSRWLRWSPWLLLISFPAAGILVWLRARARARP